MKKRNKGITLIALVITIIVMLILVGVTITMAVNGGLFEYAGKASQRTNNAVNLEQDLAAGKITVGDTSYESVNAYIDDVTETEPEQEKVTITVQKSNAFGDVETFDFPKGLTFGEAIDQGLVDTTRWSYVKTGNTNLGVVYLGDKYLAYWDENDWLDCVDQSYTPDPLWDYQLQT